jgi:16S rRNA (adenine1518-N6/adenine1519-N6)-dimethyltransferase
LGALTHELLKHLDLLSVIEIDNKLAQKWQAHEKVEWLAADALSFDLNQHAQKIQAQRAQSQSEKMPAPEEKSAKTPTFKIVGNLPYHISSPLLFHYLKFKSNINKQCFMLQKEVIERILAKHSHKEYGRLSIILQANYKMHHVLDVPPEAFFPPPKVHSSVISMQPQPIILNTRKAL